MWRYQLAGDTQAICYAHNAYRFEQQSGVKFKVRYVRQLLTRTLQKNKRFDLFKVKVKISVVTGSAESRLVRSGLDRVHHTIERLRLTDGWGKSRTIYILDEGKDSEPTALHKM